jgi:hypothetical protein
MRRQLNDPDGHIHIPFTIANRFQTRIRSASALLLSITTDVAPFERRVVTLLLNSTRAIFFYALKSTAILLLKEGGGGFEPLMADPGFSVYIGLPTG